MSHVLTDEDAATYIALGVTAAELVRLGFPDADDELADFLLWEKTPFPVVRGVHDIADCVAELVAEGPRCDEPTDRKPYRCRRKVRRWGDPCGVHRPALTVVHASTEPTPDAPPHPASRESEQAAAGAGS